MFSYAGTHIYNYYKSVYTCVQADEAVQYMHED